MQASIPPNDYHRLLHKYPELRCWEADVRSKAWDKFLASDEAPTLPRPGKGRNRGRGLGTAYRDARSHVGAGLAAGD